MMSANTEALVYSPEHRKADIDAAADKAVKKVFAILGVDVNKPESVEAFREDLRFGRKMRKLADKGLIGIVGIVGAGIAAAIWAGLITFIKRG